MIKSVQTAMLAMSQHELDIFNKSLFTGIQEMTKDYLKIKKENPGKILYKVHNPLKGRARRRRGKSHYFSDHA